MTKTVVADLVGIFRAVQHSEGSGFLFPERPTMIERGDKGNLTLTPSQMISNLQTHLRAAEWKTSGTRCTPSE